MTSTPTSKVKVEVLPGTQVEIGGPYANISPEYVQKYMASGAPKMEQPGVPDGTVGDRFKGIAASFAGLPGDWQELAQMGGDALFQQLAKQPVIGNALGYLAAKQPQRTLPNTWEVGEKMGADTESDEFLWGSFGLPGLEDAFRPHTAMVLLHGTPHKFDKFDYSKIDTGEGAQAFGYGLYFTQDGGVARQYKRNLSGGDGLELTFNTIPWNQGSQGVLYDAAKAGDWEVVEELAGVSNQRDFDSMMRGLVNLEDSAQYAPFDNVNDYIEGFLDDYIDDMHYDAFGQNIEQFTPPGEKIPKLGWTEDAGDIPVGDKGKTHAVRGKTFHPLDTYEDLDNYTEMLKKQYIDPLGDEEKQMASYALDEFRGAMDQRMWLAKNADAVEMKRVNSGHIYDIDIPDARTARWLRWNEPLKDQPENVQEAIGELLPVESLVEMGVRYGKPKGATWKFPQPRRTLRAPPQPGDPGFEKALEKGWIKGQKAYSHRTQEPTDKVIYWWSGHGNPETDPLFQEWYLVRDGEWGNTKYASEAEAVKASQAERNKVYAKAKKYMDDMPGEELYYELARRHHDLAVDAGLKPGTKAYKQFTESRVSRELNDLGVKGHLFLRGGKRDQTVGKFGDYNAVIYTTDEIEQVKRDGEIVYSRPKPETAK